MKNIISLILIFSPSICSAEQDALNLSCIPEYWTQMSSTGTASTEWGKGIENILKFDFTSNIISGGHTDNWSYKINKLSNSTYQGINGLGENRVYVFSENKTKLMHLVSSEDTLSAFFYKCN